MIAERIQRQVTWWVPIVLLAGASATSCETGDDRIAGGAGGAGAADGSVADVYYVPTPEPVVKAMIELADPQPGETLYDLGSGDGRIVIAAAKHYQLKGVGLEIDPDQLNVSVENARKAGVAAEVRFLNADMFKTPLRDADIVTLYVGPKLTLEMKPHLLEKMRPGARLVCQGFSMGDWEPDGRVIGPTGSPLYLWVIPGAAAGTHVVKLNDEAGGPPREVKLDLEQKYQTVTGTATFPGGPPAEISGGRLRGNELTFTAQGKTYTVTLGGDKT